MAQASNTGRASRAAALLAAVVLAVAAFNLTFRLGQESIQEWDESLYATSAWEMVHSGDWIGTTINGELDYYNTKPPLNVWLIAVAFRIFGPTLVSLRLTSVVSAFLTILLLQRWTWRHLGPRVAVLASLILSTTFGFFYIHSAKTANTDPLFTLLMLLTAMTLVAESTRPWQRVWFGPILAAVFLLRGMAVLMPAALIASTWLLHRRTTARRWGPTCVAGALFLLPTIAWTVARYRLDRWEFLSRMIEYDFLQRTIQPIEGHPAGSLFYLTVLHRNQFDWVIAAVVAAALFPRLWRAVPWVRIREDRMTVALICWAATSLLIPTLMRTKVPWYLNPFYPVFAIGTALLIERAYGCAKFLRLPRLQLLALTAGLLTIVAAAEGRLLWYSLTERDLGRSGQSLLLAEQEQLRGHRVYQDEPRQAAAFVAAAVGAKPQHTPVSTIDLPIAPGDYLLTGARVEKDDLELVRSNGRRWLYRRRGHPADAR